MPFPITEILKESITSHFKKKKLEWSEKYFIEQLSSDRKYDVYWSVLALRDCGSKVCIPYLKKLISYPMQDVKCTSILTIAHIARESETEFYCECLLSPSYKDKTYAMWAINDAANDQAIDCVLRYFEKNKNKVKNGKLTNGTLVDGCQYLAKYTDHPLVEKFFAFVVSNSAKIAEGEKNELIKRIPYFGIMA